MKKENIERRGFFKLLLKGVVAVLFFPVFNRLVGSIGEKKTDLKGYFDGFFCPCHHFDTSGRIRKGSTNLELPKYKFFSDSIIKIGDE
tara:strand:+ start:133 stop:396 length:264 start_codon:yes stop_codon:yes gene_type:complete